mgnify:CR=1 FL=1
MKTNAVKFLFFLCSAASLFGQEAKIVSVENKVEAAKGAGLWAAAQAEQRLAIQVCQHQRDAQQIGKGILDLEHAFSGQQLVDALTTAVGAVPRHPRVSCHAGVILCFEPVLDSAPGEAPLAAHFYCGHAPVVRHAVDGRAVDVQNFLELACRQELGDSFGCHTGCTRSISVRLVIFCCI